MVGTFVVEGFVLGFLGSDEQAGGPRAVQAQGGVAVVPQVGGVAVHVHTKAAILEDAAGEQALPDFEGLDQILVGEADFAFDGSIDLLGVDVVGDVEPGVDVDPVVLGADGQRQFAVLAQGGADGQQLVIVGGNAQTVGVQLLNVGPNEAGIGQAQRQAVVVAVGVQQAHAEVKELALPALAVGRLGIGGQVDLIGAEFVIGGTGLHAVDVRAFAVVHLDLHIGNVIAVGHVDVVNLDVGVFGLEGVDDLVDLSAVAGVPGLERDGDGLFCQGNGAQAQQHGHGQKQADQFLHGIRSFSFLNDSVILC